MKTDAILPVGKLPMELLATFLKDLKVNDPNVLVGPGLGQDAAAIRFGAETLLFKTDPITFAVDDMPWYLVTVNSNDIACMGGIPRYMLTTVLLPEGCSTAATVGEFFDGLKKACAATGVVPVGGHTEITYGIERPIAAGFMIGTLLADEVICTKNASAGDVLLLSKGIPLEAISLLAREKSAMIKADAETLSRAQNLIYDPGISVVREAHLAVKAGGVKAMHDPTEGGLATGLKELACAAGCGLEVEMDRIPLLDLARPVLKPFGIDPLGAIASGSLLLSCDEKHARAILDAWQNAGISGALIGRLTPEEDYSLIRNGKRESLPEFAVDEIARVFTG